MVSKINYKSIRLPLFLVMASACALGPWQCLPGPIFHPRNFNIKIGPGDEAKSRSAFQFTVLQSNLLCYE